jgi:hypothetical protein
VEAGLAMTAGVLAATAVAARSALAGAVVSRPEDAPATTGLGHRASG